MCGRHGRSDVSELLALLSRPNVVSFAGRIPDPSPFPDEALRAAYDFVLSHPKRAATALQYSVPEGDPDLRAWIAEDMSRRGVRCAVENVLITSGSQRALDFLGKLFVSPERRFSPGARHFLEPCKRSTPMNRATKNWPGQTATAAR